ncbi:MAG: hypothetical protein AAB296_04565 [Candidatus Desantisbacteria bacterium]
MRLSKKILASIGLMGLLFCVGCATTIKYHPAYLEKKGVIKKIAVMPPEATVYLVTATEGNKVMHDVSLQVENVLLSEIENLVKEKKIVYQHVRLTEEDLGKEPDLKFELTKVQEKFTQINQEILNKARTKEINYSIGSDINQFADRADADALIFIRGAGFKKSAGQVTKDIFKAIAIGIATAGVVQPSGNYTHYAQELQIAIVDGDTGDILWYNKGLLEINPNDEGGIKNLLNSIFSKFPEIK